MIKKEFHISDNDIDALFILCSVVFQIKMGIDITICPYDLGLDFFLKMSGRNMSKFASLDTIREKYKSKIKENSLIDDDKIMITSNELAIGEIIIDFKDCN